MSLLALVKISFDFITLIIDDSQQPLNEVVRFVLHEDDQLCASAVQFMASLDKWIPTYEGYQVSLETMFLFPDNYLKVASSFQVIRKRALLQAFVGKQDLMLSLNLTGTLLELAQSQANSTYFLIQV